MKFRLLNLLLACIYSVHIGAQEFELYQSKSLSGKWSLNDSLNQQPLFSFEPYKPVYILFANYSNNINQRPRSENPVNTFQEALDFNKTELKFQISFKTKVLRNILGEKLGGAIFLAFTQSSRWQFYNDVNSRPFRETNYAPEIIFIVPTKYQFFNLRGAYTGISITHESNGRSNPASRSWNRVIFHLGLESERWRVLVKPWIRISEDFEEDNNPNIEDYVGRGEVLIAYHPHHKHQFSLSGKHSLKGGSNSRGSMQFDYAIKVYDNLKIYTQIFHGYGESMIDFNHTQTTFGVGVSLINWI